MDLGHPLPQGWPAPAVNQPRHLSARSTRTSIIAENGATGYSHWSLWLSCPHQHNNLGRGRESPKLVLFHQPTVLLPACCRRCGRCTRVELHAERRSLAGKAEGQRDT